MNFLFIDANILVTFQEAIKKKKELVKDVIFKVTKNYQDFEKNIPLKENGYAKNVSLDEIMEKDFSLFPGAYIEIKEDKKRSESEIKSELKKNISELEILFKESKELESKLKESIKKMNID